MADEVKKEDTDKNKKEELSKEKTQKQEEKPKKDTENKKKQKAETKDTKKKDNKKPKEKQDKDKKQGRSDDFKFIVRLSNTDVDGEKKVIHGITSIKGIGIRMASLVTANIDIDTDKKVGNLTDKEVEEIQKAIDDIQNSAPTWMLNHRKDMETGEDIHLIGPQIDMNLRDEINIMKKIRSYRGIRHERGLRVRGQRTRGNNREGLSLGVSKQRQKQK